MNVNTVKMRFIDSLCPPALLYVLFVSIQVALDVSLGLFLTAAVKVGFGIIGTLLLDSLCGVQLSVVAWALVAAPFIITSLATAISMGTDADHRIVSSVRENFIEGVENSRSSKVSKHPSPSHPRRGREHFVENAANPPKVLGKVVMAKADGSDGDALLLSMQS